jgi:peptidoglycan/LPS O-acetylase OafA/YrhL
MAHPATAAKFHLLDAARGVAALLVVMRHTPTLWNIEYFHSYLAVDIFFLLSGFVIAHAYDGKLASGHLNARSFVLIRLIRLYPIYLISIVIASSLTLEDLLAHGTHLVFSASDIVSISLLSALFLPTHIGTNAQLFPLNGPLWSLFLEMTVNILYGCLHKYLDNRRLTVIIAIAGLILLWAISHTGTIDHGFKWTDFGVFIGFTRCMFGIFLGILLYRMQCLHLAARSIVSKIAALPAVALLAAMAPLLVPDCGAVNGLIDILAVSICFPATVLLMASAPTLRWGGVTAFFGSISYPIYALHMPLFHIVGAFAGGFLARHAPYGGLAFMVVMALFALALERFYDIPVRRILTQGLGILRL